MRREAVIWGLVVACVGGLWWHARLSADIARMQAEVVRVAPEIFERAMAACRDRLPSADFDYEPQTDAEAPTLGPVAMA